jgi:hypothetical protein
MNPVHAEAGRSINIVMGETSKSITNYELRMVDLY